MTNDFARRQSISGTEKQHGEDVAEKPMQQFAREVMPAQEDISLQLLQATTSLGKR
jgi:hypothetical protein